MLLTNMIGDGGVDIEEIIDIYPYIINSMIQNLEDFNDAVEEFKNKYSAICTLEDFNNYSANIEPLYKDFLEEVAHQVWKNNHCLEKMIQEIEQSKSIENNLLELISKNEEILNMTKSNISNIHNKKESLQGTRDIIQLCKLLTNTSFIYKSTNVSGYVISQISKPIHHFELNPEERSKGEMVNSLYDILEKVSSEIERTQLNGKAKYVK